MPDNKLQLNVLTQEREVFKDTADIILAPAYDGQIGILPGHIGLLTKLTGGELYIISGASMSILAITGGLMDVHNDQVTVMADSAVRADEIDIAKVEAAKAKAEESLRTKLSARDFAVAEADLRKAVLELKVSRKRHAKVPYET